LTRSAPWLSRRLSAAVDDGPGHSVETHVSTDVGALDGDEAIADEPIDAVLAAVTPVARMGR
jgi:hypothetical protein